MYSLVMLAAMTAGGAETPEFGFRSKSCHGCSGCMGCLGSSCHGCYGSCYGVSSCFGSCHGCTGCFGGIPYGGCGGCFGGSQVYYGDLHAGCHGLPGASYGAYGGCHGTPQFSCHGCYGAGFTFAGCHGGVGGVAAPPVYQNPPVFGPAMGGPALPATPAVPPGSDVGPKKEIDPKGVSPMPKKDDVSAPAELRIDVPAGGELFIDGRKVDAGGGLFHTPPLARGRKFFYDVKVVLARDGGRVEETKQIIVRAGQSVNESFASLERRLDRTLVRK